MPTVQQWGRKESIIWPPRGYLYTLGAFFLACRRNRILRLLALSIWPAAACNATTCRTTCAAKPRASRIQSANTRCSMFQTGVSDRRAALEADVQPGATPPFGGKPIAADAHPEGRSPWHLLPIARGPPQLPRTRRSTPGLRTGFTRTLRSTTSSRCSSSLDSLHSSCSFHFRSARTSQRIKQLRYGRRLKGPVLVNAKEFTKAVIGNGIGIKTDDFKLPLRIPRDAENKHFLIVGDTGSGKSSIIRQMLYQVDARGDSAIVYDPACEFVKQFYDPHRGDIVLNPLDARMPYWNPSKELRRKAEAKALAVSLYQPEGVTNRFFVEAPQKIFAHLLSYLPDAGRPHQVDVRPSGDRPAASRDTEYWMLIDPKAPQQRTGVLGSLNMSADSFRLLPKESETTSVWTATNWAETRRGWIFITSRPTMREALRPLISLWIDTLVLRLLNEPMPDQKPVWFVIDELASLQRLPQLHTAITENRKSQNPVILGFQGRSQMEARYGEDSEAMLSQPATKIFLRTTEPRAAKWVSEAIGEVEIERLRETHYDGSRAGKNFALDRQTEPLVLPSEVSGLDDLRGFLKYGNHVARFSFPFIALEEKSPGFDEREMDDLIVPSTPLPSRTGRNSGQSSCSLTMWSRLPGQVME